MTPHFVPFESMSDAEQREHLRRVHGWDPRDLELHATAYVSEHDLDHENELGAADAYRPHTHDKPAPRPEENR